ncbi:MAG: acetate--CoA ligase family protein [Aigarchaeota archaeon]|nr:acetate--CoA ligase family protein [Aigarchaeota archaeon]MDW7986351.1 acetate--CoA ligase family protein [Nitrososphaerota archaeon]
MKFLFNPRSIAVVGVSRDPLKLGSIIYHKLMRNKTLGILKAEVYPVNPRIRDLDGARVYSKISEIGESIDLVVIAVPAEVVVDIVREAGENEVKTAIIISGGFAETGRKDLDEELRRAISESSIRVLGPNTLGVLDLISGVDTFFLPHQKPLSNGRMAENLPEAILGNVAVISQSGALSEILMDCLKAGGVGIRTIVCVGNQIDLSTEDFLRYFAYDESTKVIAVYLEGVRDGRRFLNALIEASSKKPVVVMKAGKTEVASRAAYTHTASMVGSIQVYRGAFKQAGVVEVEDMEEMVDVVKAFSMLNPVRGNKLFVLTNAGGLAVLSSDLALQYGLAIPDMPVKVKEDLEELKKHGLIPQIAVVQNPLDLTAQGSSESFEQVFRIVASSSLYDLYLVMPSHQPPSLDDTVVDRLSSVARKYNVPMVVCEYGESEWSRLIRERSDKLGIPSYTDIRRAVKALSALTSYKRPIERSFKYPIKENRLRWIDSLPDGPLSEDSAIKILKEYNIEAPKTFRIMEEIELEKIMEHLSPPLVLKISSSKITHKTDVGGVLLGINTLEELVEGFRLLKKRVGDLGVEWEGATVQEMVRGVELILGSSWDAIFGPVVTIGLGGIYTEIIRDFSVRVAPIEPYEAEEMINELKMKKMLEGYRGSPRVDLKKLANAITSFSSIIFENSSIKQLEINPLIAKDDKFYAVDVRGLLNKREKG